MRATTLATALVALSFGNTVFAHFPPPPHEATITHSKYSSCEVDSGGLTSSSTGGVSG